MDPNNDQTPEKPAITPPPDNASLAESVNTVQPPKVVAAPASESQPATPVLTSAASVASSRQKKSSRRLFLILLAVVVTLGAIIAAIVLFLPDNSDPSSEKGAQSSNTVSLGANLVTAEGAVEVSQDGESWHTAASGSSLAELDYIKTGGDGRAIALLDDGSVVRLDNNSQIYLSLLVPESFEITLQAGRIYSRVAESSSREFSVVTANERFTAMGTAYTTSTSGGADSLDVYQSTVKIATNGIEVKEGNAYSTKSDKVTAIDLKKLAKDAFAQWNKDKDSEITEYKDKLGVLAKKAPAEQQDSNSAPTPTTQPAAGASAGISLSGSTSGTQGVSLSWNVSGTSAPQGFKVVRSKDSSQPTFGVHESIYVGDAKARSTLWYDDNGGSYYYRVCVYTSGGCSTYSNSVRVTSPKVTKAPIVPGGINLSISGNKLTWSLSGGTAPHGYKVALSSSPNPVYPQNSIIYTDQRSANLPEKSAGTYYVRICKYTNGTQSAGCVDYSNQVEYVVN